MRKGQRQKRRRIPEAMGNRACSVWLYVLVLMIDASVHGALLIAYGFSFQMAFRLSLSFIFFIYPLYYTADLLWSLRPSVCGILSGEIAVNRKYYMNTVRGEVPREDLLPSTISVPVYKENNDVIFQTLRQSLAAVIRYRTYSGAEANVVVSDDGIAPLLGGVCTDEKVRRLMQTEQAKLTEDERKVSERIRFYRKHGIGFVVRPAANRAGLFKKASNLNYTLRLGSRVRAGARTDDLTKEGGPFAGGYAEGDILTHDVILLLDKDSGVKERIIEAVVPEFGADEKLAYVQCATVVDNLQENYYTYATGRQVNNLFHNIWPCKALQGFFVPLVGHNVFLRRDILEKCGNWAENRVSEDYDKAICFYSMGYHGKFAQLKGLEFTESASRTFTEETGKQHRYAYGLFEMIFDGTVSQGRVRGCDMLYMLMYFCSVVNQVLLLPTVLTECYFGNIHLLWAGFLLCMACFILPPFLRGLVMSRRQPKEILETMPYTLMIAVSFVGHSYSFLTGAVRYFLNKIHRITSPFPSTSVDDVNYSFLEGLKILLNFMKKNPMFPVIAFLCLDRGVFLMTRKGLEPVTTFTYGYILFCAVLVPVLMTPQLFAGLFRKPALITQEAEGMRQKMSDKPRRGTSVFDPAADGRNMTPLIIERDEEPPATGDDAAQFLLAYRESLKELLPREELPEELLVNYEIESCLRKDPEGKKALYVLRGKQDAKPVLLRVTQESAEEDAFEEAQLLERLDHPGIPKVLDAFERDGKRYLVREYVEGHTLYEIVTGKGVLSAEDVLGIALKIGEILRYLHSQTPPVIHRDIKPQNIIVAKDGSIHLIDFGIAREHKQQRRQDTTVILTLDYASPEQYGFEQTTPLSDLYSLGVVLLFLATGGTVRTDLEAQIVNNRLRELIEQCIAFNPKARIQSADELCAFIRRGNSSRTAGRKKMAVAAGLAAAVLLLAAVSYGSGYFMERDASGKRSYDRGYTAGYTEGYASRPVFRKIEGLPEEVNGTVSANMSVPGGAYAAENEGLLFFSSDEGIWSMSAGGTGPAQAMKDRNAHGLSCADGWLYYTAGRGIHQSGIYTTERNVLLSGTDGELYISGKDFYLLTKDGLLRMDPRSGVTTALPALSDCSVLHADEKNLYYINGKDGALYRCDHRGGQVTMLLEGPCRGFCLIGTDLICSIEKDGAGKLVRLRTKTGETELLAESDAVMLNVTDNGIFFLDPAEDAIIRCSEDGRIRRQVTANRAADFNLAGSWVFYHNTEDNGRLWCVRTDGSNDHPLSSGR